MKSFKTFVKEANLLGTSRKKRKPNWDVYIVTNYNKKDIHTLESKGDLNLYNPKSMKSIVTLKSSDKIQILSTKLIIKSRSQYASVSFGRKKGLLNLNAITKPSDRAKKARDGDIDSVIKGGSHSKEFTPDKLGMGGSEYSSVGSMVPDVGERVNKTYGGDEHKQIRMFLGDIIKNITGISVLKEAKVPRHERKYNTSGDYEISKGDLKILSKNFGEIIGAMYILKTNKKLSVVGFPSNISEGLYDFYGTTKKGRTVYYSAKSAGGSSTSLENLNFIRKHFSASNPFLQKYSDEMDAIDALINVKGVYNTLYNIRAFFNDDFSTKVKEISKRMSKISSKKIIDLEPDMLDGWFQDVKENSTEDEFVSTMQSIYNDILGDLGKPRKTTEGVLREMFSSESDFDHGYIMYPMGSYIVNYMNNTPRYIEALNLLAGYANFILQATVDIDIKTTTVKIIKFSKNQFRFSYNGMSKKPANRPIGFREI